MKHRAAALGAVLVMALAVAGSALAFDCIRVSSSLQGLQASTANGGNWLLFDFSTAQGVQDTFANVFGSDVAPADAACFADAYGRLDQPLYFALGLGVAGGKKTEVKSQGARGENFGVIAWHNPNDVVLSNGTGIDHIDDSPILGALFEAAQTCGVEIPEE